MEALSRPSSFWPTVEEHEKNGTWTCAFWRSLPFIKLETLSTRLRSVKCTVNRERYTQGTNALVIELVYEDGMIWVARMTAPVSICNETVPANRLAREIACEVATLRFVRERTTIPVPTVHAYSGVFENELGMPYLIMSALPGATPEHVGISDCFSQVLPQHMPLLDRYVSSLADCYMQLSMIQFDRIGSLYLDPSDDSKYVIGPCASNGLGPFDTAWEYHTACAEDLEQRLLSLSGDTPDMREGRALVLWLYRLGIGLLADSPHNNGPFLFAHNDIGFQNTLVDNDGKIIGFVDWSGAGPVPVESFATQVFEFTGNPSRIDPDMLEYQLRFSSALKTLERSAPYMRETSLGANLLSQCHSSSLAYLVGRLYPLMTGGDNCDGELYGPYLAKFLLGVEDASPFKKSSVFREWYTATLQRVTSKRRE